MDEIWDALAYHRRDLSDCASEPIQFCGAIQSAGWFLAIDMDGLVIAASINCSELFAVTQGSLIGMQIGSLIQFGDGTAFSLSRALQDSQSGACELKISNSDVSINGNFFESKHHICVDLEPFYLPQDHDSLGSVELLRKLVFQIDMEPALPCMLAKAASHIRRLSGFDRVMIYRFEPSWDGYVIAEDARPDLESYLGLYYPASDIPPQARKLYQDSRYRMIIDVDCPPVPVETRVGLGRRELDLSCSALRAVSPFHIQYLKNMGVKASFSVPLKVNGSLWGLIACHHYQKEKFLSRELRSSCELAGQIVSGRLVDHVNTRRLKIKNEILSLSQSILDSVSEGCSALEAFRNKASELVEITDSSGLYVRLGGETFTFGHTPSDGYIHEMMQKFHAFTEIALWKSEKVYEDLSLDLDPKGIGALAVPFSIGFEDLIIWFRPEFVREVRWGGNPHQKAARSEILSPRASFSTWTENVTGRSRPWNEGAQEAAQSILFMFIKGIFKKASELSRANQELARVTRAKDEFISMVSHELRTPLGVMIGWIDILNDETNHSPITKQALEIIDRNAKLQINLINDLLDVSRIIAGKMRVSLRPNVSLAQLISDVENDLKPTAESKSVTVTHLFESDFIATVDPDRLRQVVWNLLANAIKFTPKGGTVTIKLTRVNSSYQISVSDTGIGIEKGQLSRIFDRFAQVQDGGSRSGGLGLGLSIVKALVELHGGKVAAFSNGRDQGSTFTATLPIFNLKPEIEEPTLAPYGTNFAVPSRSKGLEGLHILVAEDQEDAAFALEIALKREGAKVSLAANGQIALKTLSEQRFDLILSDIGMPEMDGLELIKRYRALELDRKVSMIPAIALTAYATSKDRAECLDAGFQNHISKPIDRQELLAVIKSLGLTNKEKADVQSI